MAESFNSTDYSGISGGPSGIDTGPTGVSESSSSSSQATPDVSSVSSLEKSSKEHLLDPSVLLYLYFPWQNPEQYGAFLQQGSQAIDNGISANPGVSMAAAMQLQMGETSADVAKRWNDGLREISERRKEEENSPMHRTLEDYHRHLVNHPDTAQAASISITSILIIASTFTGAVAGSEAISSLNPSQISFNIIQDSINPVLPLIQGDMRAELGLIGALFATAAMYQATVATIAIGTKGSTIDMEFAKNYVKRMVSLTTGPDFNQLVESTIISRMKGAAELTPERRQQLVAIVKVTLLFNALALMTKVEVGHLTMEELGAMIHPDPKKAIHFKAGDPRKQLVELIQQNLGLLSQSESYFLVSSLLQYYESQPKLEKLAEPTHAFAAIFESTGKANAEKVGNSRI